jgi:hypothetical protein
VPEIADSCGRRKSDHAQGHRRRVERRDANPRFAELRAARKWNMEADAGCDLADWIAFRAGYETMYPMIWKHKHKDFVALTFIEHHGKPRRGARQLGWLSCGEMAAGRSYSATDDACGTQGR